jgi:hypothetical protein
VNLSRALEQAIECIDKEIHSLGVDANLHEIYQAQYRAALIASKRRKQLLEARQVLERAKYEIDQAERTIEK